MQNRPAARRHAGNAQATTASKAEEQTAAERKARPPRAFTRRESDSGCNRPLFALGPPPERSICDRREGARASRPCKLPDCELQRLRFRLPHRETRLKAPPPTPRGYRRRCRTAPLRLSLRAQAAFRDRSNDSIRAAWSPRPRRPIQTVLAAAA